MNNKLIKEIDAEIGTWREDGYAFMFHFTVQDDGLRKAIHKMFDSDSGGAWVHKGTRQADETLYRVGLPGGRTGNHVARFFDDFRAVLRAHETQLKDGDSFGVHVPGRGSLSSKKITVGPATGIGDIQFMSLNDIFDGE